VTGRAAQYMAQTEAWLQGLCERVSRRGGGGGGGGQGGGGGAGGPQGV
jgi:hypothetical protein